jgi:ketosteroid isomerase-like protein
MYRRNFDGATSFNGFSCVTRGPTMATQYANDEADIRRRLDRFLQAVRAMDLEGVRPIYAADLVSFDIVPPLEHHGAAAKMKNWANVCATYERPLGYEIRELAISVGAGVAFARSLNRIEGIMKHGSRNGYWLRWTTCWRKIDGDWRIAHDQVSVPVDFQSGKAMLDLEP